MKEPVGSSRTDKAAHLADCLDLDRPELAAIRSARSPEEAYVHHLARQPRPAFRFEYHRKREMLDFLAAHYRKWRQYDPAEADRLAKMTIEDARKPRALSGIPALGQAWWATEDPSYGAAFERFYLAVPTGENVQLGRVQRAPGGNRAERLLPAAGLPRVLYRRPHRLPRPPALAGGKRLFVHTSAWRQIMLGAEGHNWYLHGMHMLPFVGLLFPEFKRAGFFARTGRSVVEEHLRGHYKGRRRGEGNLPGYQAGSVWSLWDQYALAERNGLALSLGFADRLLKATMFLLRLGTRRGRCRPSPTNAPRRAA